ncbi:MAG: hypothetical protein EOM67_00345 [Spirochaetia bacterium]|nr:hypothetical protein [Spirochaetia bacterium]
MVKKTKEQLEWEAQYDFDTLARAEEIRKNKLRLSKAVKAGKKRIADQEKALKAAKAVTHKAGKGK